MMNNNSNSKDEETDYIPDLLYSQIEKSIPIVSSEALIIFDGALLLLKRNNAPAKGEWWFPGGRIRKGESAEDALRREVKEETGLELDECRLINVYSRVFPERHDITIAYFCRSKSSNVVLNDEHSEYAFFKQLPSNLHPCMQKVITDSGWEEGRW